MRKIPTPKEEQTELSKIFGPNILKINAKKCDNKNSWHSTKEIKTLLHLSSRWSIRVIHSQHWETSFKPCSVNGATLFLLWDTTDRTWQYLSLLDLVKWTKHWALNKDMWVWVPALPVASVLGKSPTFLFKYLKNNRHNHNSHH